MTLTSYINFDENNTELEPIEKPRRIIDRSFFTNEAKNIDISGGIQNNPSLNQSSTTTEKKKRGRPKKETKRIGDDDVVPANESSTRELSMFETNSSYADSYSENNQILKSTISEIDTLNAEMMMELNQVINSRTLKKKFDYIPNIASTIASLINTKVGVVKEMNKVITDGHNLDFKKFKELKINDVDKDDNKTIMDMYKAFISVPYGTYNAPAQPSPVDLTMLNGTGINRVDMLTNPDAYSQQVSTVSAAENMMLLESNPDIKTVVKLDDVTGNMFFDVINIATGESVPNTSKPDPMFIDNLVLDRFNHIARDRNLNRTYDLIILNENKSLLEY